MKRVALAAVISLATLPVVALLWRFRDAAFLFALSVVVAAAARPAIDVLEQRLGRSLAVAVTYVLGLGLFGIFAYLVSRGVSRPPPRADCRRRSSAASRPSRGSITRSAARAPPCCSTRRWGSRATRSTSRPGSSSWSR